MLSVEQQLRYARHLTLPGFGAEGQQRLMESSVLIVGAGGLGSPAALYLAAAGVGRLGIIDDDVVDLTNLQRQILHRTADVGRAKTDSARQALTERNPEVEVIPIASRFDESNARELVRDYDVVLDAADNFPTRYLVNDAALLEERRVVHGSVYHYEGQVTVFAPGVGPCYRCLFPQPPAPGTVPSCAEAGVLGVLSILVLPLYIPTLILGARAVELALTDLSPWPALGLLAALTLFSAALAPFAAAAALRINTR